MDAVAVARFPRHHIEERVLIVVRRYILISRREPTFEFAFEASLFAFAFDTPPFAFALLYPRKTTRPIRKLYQDAKLLIFPPTQAIILKISCKATIFQRKQQHHQVPPKFLKFFDRLTPVMPRLSFCRFAPALRASLYAASLNALYAATLCAFTIWPRKARREPTYELAFEASLYAYAFDTPPYAYAL